MVKAGDGGKFMSTVKKQGLFKGPGKYVSAQTGIKVAGTATTAGLMLVALSMLAPGLGADLARSAGAVPFVGPLAATLVNTGSGLRSRLMAGRNNG